MKRKTSLVLSVALGIMLTATIFAGCKKDPVKPSEPLPTNTKSYNGTVRILIPGANDKDTLDPISGLTKKGIGDLKTLLEKKMPGLKAEITPIPWDNWIQKTETTLKAGEADIAYYSNQVFVPDYFVDHTQFMKDDSTFNEAKFDATFVDGAKFYTKYHTFDYPKAVNQIIGLPVLMCANYWFYDKQLFDDWGVSYPTANTTYAQIIDMAKKMTGKNPKTGKQNYGIYIKPTWSEWHAVGMNAVHPIKSSDMAIGKFDMAKDVEYIKDSKDVSDYFNFLVDAVKCAPAGAATGTGSEKWVTKDNDIAINLDTNNVGAYTQYVYAGKKDITDRFKMVTLPLSKDGMADFPEVGKLGVTKGAKDPKLAWEVLKTLTTDKEVLDFLLLNIWNDKLPVLKDTTNMKIMSFDMNKERYAFKTAHMFLTDDYWYWRTPLNAVITNVLAKKLDAAQAQQEFYNSTKKWVEDKKKQIGQ